MVQLLIRGDDLGYSEAVNYGIAKSVREGLVRSVGLMPNMPTALEGLQLLSGLDVCLGQHTNLCLGRPCADPETIPSLVTKDGTLKSSRAYREAYARGEEIATVADLVREITAQYERFKALTGQEPAYFEAHAIVSDHVKEALAIVADTYHLPYTDLMPGVQTGHFKGVPIAACAVNRMDPDYDPYEALVSSVRHADPDHPNIFVLHPGYVDDYLLTHSSLTLNRTKEVAMICDPAVRAWLAGQDVALITYADIA